MNIIPILSSEHACLTIAALEAIGIQKVSYRLADIVVKPGVEVLKQIKSLADFCGWPGKIMLNATLPPLKKGYYEWHSPFDGQRIVLSPAELFALIAQLAVDTLFLPVQENMEKPLKAAPYLVFDKSTSFSNFLHSVSELKEPTYLLGSFEWEELKTLIALKDHWIETEQPALDALEGILYTQDGVLNLRDLQYGQAHNVLDMHCSCRGCQNQYTRAYVHHLLAHCPLLGQRIVTEHNYHMLKLSQALHVQ